MEAVKKAIAWAADIHAVWRDQDDGGVVRKANKPWVELRPRTFREVGIPDKRQEDLETPENEGTLENPRQEVQVFWKEIDFEARFRSRSQKHKMTGWYAAVRAQSKLRSTYVKDTFLKPFDLGLATVGDVLNMPEVKLVADRTEDLAVLEFTLNATLCEVDESALGTWIDRCLVTSNLIPLDDSLQLNDEVMGWADAVHVVDDDGNYVVDEYGNFVIEG
jgi:hypothetical protein